MKNLLVALVLATSTVGWAQSLPFDFEAATTGMTGYDGATFSIVNNPSTTGNSSAKVAQIVKVNVADQWAGGKIVGVTSLDFSSASSSVLSMKFYTNEPVGTVVKVKLESPYTSEVDAVTTVSGGWETLLFDFGIPAPTGSVDLVIMPQPFTSGGGNTFYVDDIEQVAGIIATPRTDLPITFEQGTVPRHFFSFESATFTTIPNPDMSTDNSSAMVGKLVRHLGAPFGGSKITFTNNLDLANNPDITMMVWTSAPIGTNVTLKAEKPFWGEERTVQTTKTEEWELLSFNFTGAPTDMPTLTFLFDFIAGSTNVGDGSATSTFYFDNVKYSNIPLSTEEEDLFKHTQAYPNPSEDNWWITNLPSSTQEVAVYNVSGQLMDQFSVSGQENINIDATSYPSGIYFAKVSTADGQRVLKLERK